MLGVNVKIKRSHLPAAPVAQAEDDLAPFPKNSMKHTKLIFLVLLFSSGVLSADRTLSAEVSQTAQPYADRAHWFQLSVPDGWQVSSKGKGSNLSEVLTLKDPAFPGAQITLQIRQLKELPELVTRDQLLEQARAILKAATLQKSLGPIREITGQPMTGVTAEYAESSGVHTRLTMKKGTFHQGTVHDQP